MKLVLLALRRPVTIVVAVIAMALCSWLAVKRMPVDILPNVGAPVVYIAQPYGGMDPQQMEGYLTYYYEYHLLYVTGIQSVESKSIQGAALLKCTFYPGTDMADAMAQVVGYVNRSRSFMPPGAVPPFITRFDPGSVSVAQLVFRSDTRSVAEMQTFALNNVRPLFATLPGVSAPPPFGGNQRTIVVRLDPDKLRSYRMSPEEAIAAVNRATVVTPSGVVRTGDLARIATSNAVIGADFNELNNAPVRTGSGTTVYLRDIGVAESGTDIVSGYAQVNGKRTVYIPVTKRSDASTLAVLQRVRESLPVFRKAVPEDVAITLEFDQSRIVSDALRALAQEGVLGAVLTGLMVLLFLRDWRSALIVVATIPFSLLSAVVFLWVTGQTINIMTLAGLALAVGVLVDEATVEIENIHTHMDRGIERSAAVVEACRKTATPRLLSMLVVLSVFVPSFFMTGVARQLFVPLSFAVGFAMISSYLLSSTLVPVLSVWLMKPRPERAERRATAYRRYLEAAMKMRWPLVLGYAVVTMVAIYLLVPRIGREIFPRTDTGLLQIRMRAPVGTRVEKTELLELRALDILRQTVGPEHIEITTAFIGAHPAAYPVSTIHLWSSGQFEALMRVALKPSAPLRGEALKDELRKRFASEVPEVSFSFESADIVAQVMSFGSPTPVEVAVTGPSLANNATFAKKLETELRKIPMLRDVQYGQPLEYPTLEINIDRDRAGQYNLSMADISKSMLAATSSSRFVEPNYWRDPISGNGFQIQVEIPQGRMQSIDDLARLPVMKGDAPHPLLGDIAQMKFGKMPGQVDRLNGARVVSLTANIHGAALSDAATAVREAVARVGEPPRGITVNVRGQIPPLDDTISGLQTGLAIAIAAIFLLLVGYFQSLRLAVVILAAVPAVLLGVTGMLLLTGTTLSIQSFLGAIMAVGISVANAILLVSFAEGERASGLRPREAAVSAAAGRLRAVSMTALAMTAGMVPLALSSGESAPLGRAVIGGLLLATFATLTVLPAVYTMVHGSGAYEKS